MERLVSFCLNALSRYFVEQVKVVKLAKVAGKKIDPGPPREASLARHPGVRVSECVGIELVRRPGHKSGSRGNGVCRVRD
jgi:hypothetical protein